MIINGMDSDGDGSVGKNRKKKSGAPGNKTVPPLATPRGYRESKLKTNLKRFGDPA